MKPKRPLGRPRTKGDLNDPAVVQELCDRVASGEAIMNICKDAHMPTDPQVYLRMARDEAFRAIIARAREAQQEREADMVVALADEATNEDHQVVKLRIWARQWRAGKLAPKKFGDKTLIGSDPENPLPAADNADIARQVAFMLAKESRK